MDRKIIIKSFAVALGVIFLGLFLEKYMGRDGGDRYFQIAMACTKDFDIKVNAVGVLDAARSHMVSSPIGGDRGKLTYLIKDGSRVSNGDVLIKLDPTPFEEEVHRLKGDVEALQAAVDSGRQIYEWEKNQVAREVKTAEYNLKVAELDIKQLIEGDGPLKTAQFRGEMKKAGEKYFRYRAYIQDLEDLSRKGYKNQTEITLANEKTSELREEFESAEKKFISYREHVLPAQIEKGRATVKQAETELGQIRDGSVFRVAKVAAALEEIKSKLANAEISLERARTDLERTVIRAPIPGIAILFEAFREGQKRKPRIGDRVWQNQPILYLPDVSAMIVKTQIREVDLHKVTLGQKCMVEVDAYPELQFESEVSFIGALAAERAELGMGEKYFQLTVSLKKEDTRLRPGMTARISIVTDSLRKILTVPVQAVFEEDGEAYCYHYLGDGFEKVRVTVGRQNEDMVEILDGLKKGDRVSLIRPEDLAGG